MQVRENATIQRYILFIYEQMTTNPRRAQMFLCAYLKPNNVLIQRSIYMYILIIRYKQYNKQKVSSMSNWTSQNLKLFGQVLIKMSLKIGLKESVA